MDLFLIATLSLLPTLGLFAGPSYAAIIFASGVIRFTTTAVRSGGKIAVAHFDRRLMALGACFAGLSLASAFWSIAPHKTLSSAVQTAGILGLTILFLAEAPTVRKAAAAGFVKALTISMVIGALLITVDTFLDYPIQGLTGHDEPSFKYNRGIDYLLLILWPVLAVQVTRRNAAATVLLLCSIGIAVAVGVNSTARVALVLGLAVLALAWRAPLLVEKVLAAAFIAIASLLPFALRLAGGWHDLLLSRIKDSGIHRLEIWNYVSARIIEKPLTGWGLSASPFLPVHADEAGRFVHADGHGVYPHNQFLQLWVETGILGATIGIAFGLAALYGIRRLSPPARPFAYACFISAMSIAFTGFEITTDSWWAALGAAAFLFRALDQLTAAAPAGEGTASGA